MSVLTNPMIRSNRIYNALKYTAQIVLPAIGTLYFALAQIWGLVNAEEVVGTIVAINTFLGVLLGVNTVAYNNSGAKYDGSIDISEDEETKRFILNVDEDPYELERKQEITLRVKKVAE